MNAPKPRGTFVPDGYASRFDAFMDLIRFGPSKLPMIEFLALLFIAERSLGYAKESDAPSLNQMSAGIQKRDGQWIRGNAGIKKAACAKALAALAAKSLIQRTRRYAESGACLSTSYKPNWESIHTLFFGTPCPPDGQGPVHDTDKEPVRPVDKPCPPDGQGLVHDADKGLVCPTDQACPPGGQQQKLLNRSDHHQQRLEQNKGALTAQGRAAGPQVSAVPTVEPESQSQDRLTSQLADDDEKSKAQGREPKPDREPAATPEEEFRFRLEERHGKHFEMSDREEWFRNVKGDLSDSNISLPEYLEFDKAKTTNPAGLNNPPGYYRGLVKKMMASRKTEALEYRLRLNKQVAEFLKPPVADKPAAPKCALCHEPVGRGLKLVKDNDGKSKFEFCECATEEFREEWAAKEAQRIQLVAERAKAAEVKSVEGQSHGKLEAA